MGMCLPCLGGAADDVVVTPDPETRRQQLAEAAEKRQKEVSYDWSRLIVHFPSTKTLLHVCSTLTRLLGAAH